MYFAQTSDMKIAIEYLEASNVLSVRKGGGGCRVENMILNISYYESNLD